MKKVYLGMIADVIHPGLINIINEGSKYGELIIGLFSDKAIATHKRLPYLTYEQRKQIVENIKSVSIIIHRVVCKGLQSLLFWHNCKKVGLKSPTFILSFIIF